MTHYPPYPSAHPDAATLEAYHDGELNDAPLTVVEAHLASCPRCRQELRELDRLDAALGALPALEPSPDAYDRVLARAAQPRPRPARSVRFTPRRPLWALTIALAALAALVGGYDFLVTPRAGLIGNGSYMSALPPALHQLPTPIYGRAVPAAPAGGQSNSGAPVKASAPMSAPATRPSIPQQGRQSGATGAGLHNGLPLSPDARLIARTGEVDLRVPDVQKTYTAVGGVAARAGGYVSDSNDNAYGATSGAYAATLTLRVPAARFEDAMGRLAALAPRGGLLHERSSSADITDGYHDLQAQLQALQATRAQLMAIMHKAGNIPDAMTVLDRLTDVNTSIDSVQGQITASANTVMFSTITVNIAAQPRTHRHIVVPPPRRTASGGWQPGRDVVSALSNLGAALRAIITVAIYAVVYLALPAALAGLALLSRRARHRAPRGA